MLGNSNDTEKTILGTVGLKLEVHKEYMNKMRTFFDYLANACFILRVKEGDGGWGGD